MEETKDLRDATETIGKVKDYAEEAFGFKPWRVVPLETCDDPADYCMFEACGVEYQVDHGLLSIRGQGARDE